MVGTAATACPTVRVGGLGATVRTAGAYGRVFGGRWRQSVSVHYSTVQWTKRKVVYDVFALLAVVAFLQLFRMASSMAHASPATLDARIIEMRAWGSCGFLMLTVILSIGPLARVDRRFVPLLYNRRHLGVLMCIVALMHAYYVLGYYYAYGSLEKVEALFRFDAALTASSAPFTLFGVGALVDRHGDGPDQSRLLAKRPRWDSLEVAAHARVCGVWARRHARGLWYPSV